VKVKVRSSLYSPEEALVVPGGWGSLISRRWQRCQLYSPDAFNSQEIFPVFISVRDWVHPWTILRPERLREWKIPVWSAMPQPTASPRAFHVASNILVNYPMAKFPTKNAIFRNLFLLPSSGNSWIR
jgi:hypothetical protein